MAGISVAKDFELWKPSTRERRKQN